MGWGGGGGSSQGSVTSEWHNGGDRREVHHGVAVWVEAAIKPDEALGRALGHAVVAGDDDVDSAPQARALQLRHQQAHVVVHLAARGQKCKLQIEQRWET